MRLRQLRESDAELMLEWLLDSNVTAFFRFDSSQSTLESAREYIRKAKAEKDSVHFAITEDDNDDYLGTISLKNISQVNRNAEYAICLRSAAIGKNVSKQATDLILKYGFEELKLHRIYLDVLSENVRAVKFYEKYGFIYEGEFREHLMHKGKLKSLKFFAAINPAEQ